MKLEKAINHLADLHKAIFNRLTPEEKVALKLGIEALNRLEDWRQGKVLNPDLLLPGETED